MSVHRQMMLAIETIPFLAIQFGGSFLLLMALAWPLAIPVFVWIAANMLVAWAAIPAYMRRSEKVAAAMSRAAGAMTDVYSNIAMVKLFAAEDSEAGAIRKVIGETIDTRHNENRAYILTDSGVYFLNVLMILAVVAIGFWGMSGGWVSIGDFVAGLTVTRSLSHASSSFIGVGQSNYQHARHHSRRHADHDQPAGHHRPARRRATGCRKGRDPLRQGLLPLPQGREVGPGGFQSGDRARRTGRSGRPFRRRQVNGRFPADAPARRDRRQHHHRRPGHTRRYPGLAAKQHRPW
jgi:hypothetical protein